MKHPDDLGRPRIHLAYERDRLGLQSHERWHSILTTLDLRGAQRPDDGTRHAAILKELRSGKLSTASAFQARFGSASSIRESDGGPVLHYHESEAELLVTFPAKGAPRFQMVRLVPDAEGRQMSIPVEVDQDYALARLSSNA